METRDDRVQTTGISDKTGVICCLGEKFFRTGTCAIFLTFEFCKKKENQKRLWRSDVWPTRVNSVQGTGQRMCMCSASLHWMTWGATLLCTSNRSSGPFSYSSVSQTPVPRNDHNGLPQRSCATSKTLNAMLAAKSGPFRYTSQQAPWSTLLNDQAPTPPLFCGHQVEVEWPLMRLQWSIMLSKHFMNVSQAGILHLQPNRAVCMCC